MRCAYFLLRANQTAAFVLEDASAIGPDSPAQSRDYVSESFKETMNFWQRWTRKSQYTGRWREMVNRSALMLKLLTSERHGSFVAAPTFGLPEDIGGGGYAIGTIATLGFAIRRLPYMP